MPVRQAARNPVEAKELLSKGLTIGPSSYLEIPIDGKFYFATPDGSCIAASQDDINHLEDQMMQFTISFSKGEARAKTAAQVLFEASQQQANLRSLVRLKRSAMEEVFKLWAMYLNEEEPESYVALNDDLLNQ